MVGVLKLAVGGGLGDSDGGLPMEVICGWWGCSSWPSVVVVLKLAAGGGGRASGKWVTKLEWG